MTIGIFKEYKHEIVSNVEDAEVIVINTCGFIESAKQEAINTILEMAEYKDSGSCKALIVTGCLAQRYRTEIKKEMLTFKRPGFGISPDRLADIIGKQSAADI